MYKKNAFYKPEHLGHGYLLIGNEQRSEIEHSGVLEEHQACGNRCYQSVENAGFGLSPENPLTIRRQYKKTSGINTLVSYRLLSPEWDLNAS